jgi:hypothetical protein
MIGSPNISIKDEILSICSSLRGSECGNTVVGWF